MTKILVVDDEPRYREHLNRALTRDGYQVFTAANARDAIAAGTRFRPDVLVADWMLKDDLHGLHVSEALRTFIPNLKTILITGFPSTDLRDDARSLQVSEFVEKPFELARLRNAVQAVEIADPTPLDRSPIAVLEVTGNGTIHLANERARQLLGQARVERQANDRWNLSDVTDLHSLTEATENWIPFTPSAAPDLHWHMRAKPYADNQGWLVVIVPDDQRQHKEHPVVRMLLNLEPAESIYWPVPGRTLIVDDDRWVRHVITAQIENGGGVCHAAENTQAALQTCRRDSGIELVILDYDLPGDSIYDFVTELRSLRPEVRIVGTSGSNRAEEFVRAGVRNFLLKPWAVSDLVNLLLGRLGKCVSCDLPLPLRHARPGEVPQSWVCAGCGARYSALLDEELSTKEYSNARLVEDA
ncbi:MAG: response regulator [Planctomycetota bacterium]